VRYKCKCEIYDTVKMNALYLIKKKCGNRLQAILLIKFKIE